MLPATVTACFGRDSHRYFNKKNRRGRALVKWFKRQAHRAERRKTKTELKAGKEPELRHQVTGWDII
jgi:hypothetical protein